MGILSEMLTHGQQHRMVSLPVAMLFIRLVLYGSILYGSSYYTVVAGSLVPSAASC